METIDDIAKINAQIFIKKHFNPKDINTILARKLFESIKRTIEQSLYTYELKMKNESV
jgi:hypothetical protein